MWTLDVFVHIFSKPLWSLDQLVLASVQNNKSIRMMLVI